MSGSTKQAKSVISKHTDDSDNPWKEILEILLPDFMEFFFPHANDAIDWTRGYKFLDNEFRKIMRDAAQINRRVDKLVQVYLKTGEMIWILLHIEIHGYKDIDFPNRMFVSWYRIYDKYKLTIVSFALLTDEDAAWKPAGFSQDFLGTSVFHKYNSVKLLQYKDKKAELDEHLSPMAVIVNAHLEMQATKKNPRKRRIAKMRLVRGLYVRGFTRKEIVSLYKFIDPCGSVCSGC